MALFQFQNSVVGSPVQPAQTKTPMFARIFSNKRLLMPANRGVYHLAIATLFLQYSYQQPAPIQQVAMNRFPKPRHENRVN